MKIVILWESDRLLVAKALETYSGMLLDTAAKKKGSAVRGLRTYYENKADRCEQLHRRVAW